ncbi:MAG: UDP-N-acetylglucosamine--N-acetylmuramyl-(pentapeptide) pyrophosphoryl-undecaprenol N-acetylglucosamine transferase, partial [Ruminococcaceae bacterium]|nr:UDP-N-acetylglucosamine--N-acetylmuramyl-(pentapeptide) pyrophosphoryl-undecaprenol N-acetylglucosamine transferase [Oscillospiraceae bacterium]
MKILFAGGGTAGHINPALAVADYIKERHPDAEISYIGTAEKLEAKLVPEKGYDFHTIKVAGFRRSLSPSAVIHNVNAVKLAATSLMSAKKILKQVKPDVVVGTGGYVSGPVLRAAQQLGI